MEPVPSSPHSPPLIHLPVHHHALAVRLLRRQNHLLVVLVGAEEIDLGVGVLDRAAAPAHHRDPLYARAQLPDRLPAHILVKDRDMPVGHGDHLAAGCGDKMIPRYSIR
jgi:hypothetical protein